MKNKKIMYLIGGLVVAGVAAAALFLGTGQQFQGYLQLAPATTTTTTTTTTKPATQTATPSGEMTVVGGAAALVEGVSAVVDTGGGGGAGAPQKPLSVTCTAMPATAAIGEDVTWTATVSPAQGGTYLWGGDAVGLGSTATVVKHGYTTSGAKTATVIVTASGGGTASTSCSMKII